MILIGNVTSGMGTAKKFVEMMSERFYNITGTQLYSGTLNIKLEKPYNLKTDFIIESNEYGGNFNVQVQKCKLLKEDAYIVRSEKNTNDNGDYKQDIIEIISAINFREKYGLKDGTLVEVEI